MAAVASQITQTDPDTTTLWRVLRHLERTRNHRAIVGLVERWFERGDAPLEALLVEARVLFHLRALPQALERVRRFSTAVPEHIDAHLLGARILLARESFERVDEILQRVRDFAPDHPGLLELEAERDLARNAPMAPPPQAGIAELIHYAERKISLGHGAAVRPTLEEVRAKRPDNGRVADLLWALDGDWRGPLSLEELARVHAPPQALGEWDQLELTDSVILGSLEPDLPTCEVSRLGEDSADDPVGFPSLFRGFGSSRVLSGDDEATEAYEVAAELDDVTNEAMSEPGGDTRIMSVIGMMSEDLSGMLPEVRLDYDYDGAELTAADDGLVVFTDQEETEQVTEAVAPVLAPVKAAVLEGAAAPLVIPTVDDSQPTETVVKSLDVEDTDEILQQIRGRQMPPAAFGAGVVAVLIAMLALLGRVIG